MTAYITRYLCAGIICGCTMLATAQDDHITLNSKGKTSAEELQGYGIALTEPSLRAALKHGSPSVRVLAAHQLQSDNALESVPAIEDALVLEKDPLIGVGIATALAGLHDPQGEQYLQVTCANTALSTQARFSAVQMLASLNLSSVPCIGAVVESLSNTRDLDYRDATISLLPAMYGEMLQKDSDRVVKVLESFLNDPDQQASVRLAAGQALAEIGSPSLNKVLQRAILKENDPAIRASLQDDLDSVEKKH